jgi:hypothetical protein
VLVEPLERLDLPAWPEQVDDQIQQHDDLLRG